MPRAERVVGDAVDTDGEDRGEEAAQEHARCTWPRDEQHGRKSDHIDERSPGLAERGRGIDRPERRQAGPESHGRERAARGDLEPAGPYATAYGEREDRERCERRTRPRPRAREEAAVRHREQAHDEPRDDEQRVLQRQEAEPPPDPSFRRSGRTPSLSGRAAHTRRAPTTTARAISSGH